MSAMLAKLKNCLQSVYWQLISHGWVHSSTPKHLRMLNSKGFYIGTSCPHPGIKCFIAQMAKLPTHYGCHSGVRIQLQVSMELLIIKPGMTAQPLLESYTTCGKQITHSHSWIKLVWEKACKFSAKMTGSHPSWITSLHFYFFGINPYMKKSQLFSEQEALCNLCNLMSSIIIIIYYLR